jgi:hypothetical protein
MAHILAEIARTAKANKGAPLGVRRVYTAEARWQRRISPAREHAFGISVGPFLRSAVLR